MQKIEEVLESAWFEAEQKLTEAAARIEELERQLREAKAERDKWIEANRRHITDMLDYWKQEAAR